MSEDLQMYEQLQGLLDVFSQTPGAILYRAPGGWTALLPGNVGQVLTLNTELLPEWQDPA